MSNNRRLKKLSCTGKVAHKTVEGANKAREIIYIKAKRRGDYSKINVYRCKFCGHYHVGHETAYGRKRRLGYEK